MDKRRLYNEKFYNFYRSINIAKVIKCRRIEMAKSYSQNGSQVGMFSKF
jgi:hypothetical protein